MTATHMVHARLAAIACALGASFAAAAAEAPPPGGAHGLSIPTTHPRLWFDAARLARAKAWYRSRPFTPSSDDHLGKALRGLLAGESSQCRAAIDWALAASGRVRRNGVSCDECRWSGETIILVYDWCHAYVTPEERARFIALTNAWVDHWRTQAWGGVGSHTNNYYWGYLRNELEWGIATWEDNTSMARTFLADAIGLRLEKDFHPAAATTERGGVGHEGSQYGPYVMQYATVPLVTAGLLGRDLLGESDYWKEAVYAFIYSTTPATTTSTAWPRAGYAVFPFSDDEMWRYGPALGPAVADFMTAAAMRWSGAKVGQHARRWLDVTRASRSRHVQAVDPGGPAQPFGTLPLDYYAPGPKYLYGRSAWDAPSTAFMLQLGEGPGFGHAHADWGTWQLWRNGRFLSRETASYGENVAGHGGQGTASAALALGHNSLLIDGTGPRSDPWSRGAAVVRRLESQPAYAYAAVDLSAASNNPEFVRWVREFVFVRALETLVILDRVQSRTASATRTFLAHCETSPETSARSATCVNGDHALVLTTLVPASPRYRAVAEGGPVGQFRIEVDAAPDGAQSHILTVLQAKDRSGASLSPAVKDGGAAWVLTLDASTRVVFEKGMASAGGSIEIGGVSKALRKDVQGVVVTEDGPAWR